MITEPSSPTQDFSHLYLGSEKPFSNRLKFCRRRKNLEARDEIVFLFNLLGNAAKKIDQENVKVKFYFGCSDRWLVVDVFFVIIWPIFKLLFWKFWVHLTLKSLSVPLTVRDVATGGYRLSKIWPRLKDLPCLVAYPPGLTKQEQLVKGSADMFFLKTKAI